MEVISPINGDMLHARDGVVVGDGTGAIAAAGLRTVVTVAAEASGEIWIGGVQGVFENGVFTAEVVLADYENRVDVVNKTTGERLEVVVYWLPSFAGGYRLSIDDNIWFLRDIYNHAGVYRSIFDNSYLAFLKELNVRYGTKVHVNLFYETEGFDLSMLSDEFKEEWKAQAGWLRLSFHALGEFPDKPYQKADYDTVKSHCEMVMTEIRRFAGEELMGPVTTLHWGEATVEGSRALRDLGYVGQLGYFNVDDELPAVSYYLSVAERRHIKKRFVWKDVVEGIVFIRSSIVIDKTELGAIRGHLDGHRSAGGLPPYVDLLVHEQYYYPFYFNYQPDFKDRILTAVQWAQENGYVPEFLEECIL